MPKITKPLSAKEVEAAKAREKDYKLFDGEGLYLLVKTNGKKYWRLKYRIAGKEKSISLGTYPITSLQAAREERSKCKKLLANGINPSSARKEEKKKQNEEIERKTYIFSYVSQKYFEYLPTLADPMQPDHLKKQSARIHNHVLPHIGTKFIGDISREDILDVIEKIKAKNQHETARRVLALIKGIFDFSIDNGWAAYNHAASINSTKIIGKKTSNHYPIITDVKKLKILLEQIEEYTGHYTVKQALHIMPYVALRIGNIRFAEWNEINFEKRIWRIPAHKMKTGGKHQAHYYTADDHIIPLTASMLKIFEETKKLTGNSQYIFESPIHRGKPMSENTLNQAIRRMGYTKEELTSHSFRGIFSTLAHENLNEHGQDPIVIEMQLAHKEPNEVKAAYNHAKYMKQRRELMQWWSDYLDRLRPPIPTL